MFSCEIKINSQLIIHIKGQNEGLIQEKENECLYKYTCYSTETTEVSKGVITHKRKDGLGNLIKKILEDTTYGNSD